MALAEDFLPLPQQGSLPVRGAANAIKPTVVIKPPTEGTVTVPVQSKPDDARELAILELERQLVEDMVRHQIALAHVTGNASALKQLILMHGPVDAAISRAPRPPTAAQGKVALIGLAADDAVHKHLEQFFGVPVTPDSQRQLLETVKSQLAAGKEQPGIEVRIAGWWPEQGVLAVSVVPRG
ncbi:MAG: hypothetical protein ACOYMN_06085 [Roseimicrobium sp.]